jgi:hypothetical protein
MSGTFTPDIYVAGIVGALQANLQNGKSAAQPSTDTINQYLTSTAATQAIDASDIVAIRAYLGTPASAAIIKNAVTVAIIVVQHLGTHTPAAPASAPTPIGKGGGLQRDVQIPTGLVTIPVVGGEVRIYMTSDQVMAAGIGAAVNDEPGLQDDELGNALVGILGSAAVLAENILETAAKEVFIQGLKAAGAWVVANRPHLPGTATVQQVVQDGMQQWDNVIISQTVPTTGGPVEISGGGGGKIPDGTVTVIEGR